MQRRIQKWKRFLAIFLMGAMLLTNDYGVVQAIADITPQAKNNQGESPANIAFDARLIVNEDDDATVVETGESFQYEFSYTVPSLGGNGGSAYSGTKLIFTLPEYVELDVDDDGKPKIMGIDYKDYSYDSETKQHVVTLKSPLTMYNANTLTIAMKTKNMVTPSGVELNFNTTSDSDSRGEFYFQTQYSYNNVPGKLNEPVDAGTITTTASSNWQIEKSVVKQKANGQQVDWVRDGDSFKVIYRVTVKDEPLPGSESQSLNRPGRLGFTAYQVIDTLPQYQADGKSIPQGGEATEISDVKIVHGSQSYSVEYSVQKSADGKVQSITINEYDKIRAKAEGGAYLQVNDATNTTYEYTVKYPYAPYTTSSDTNVEDAILHTLKNKAELNYTLVGGIVGKDEDDATIQVGAWEDNVTNADVYVAKFIQIGTGEQAELYPLTSEYAKKYNLEGTDTVKFTLYKDSACTNVAYNISRVEMSYIAVDENGVAKFPNIRKGTYYIKEEYRENGTIDENWSTPSVVKVEIKEVEKGDGTVEAVVQYSAAQNGSTFETINIDQVIDGKTVEVSAVKVVNVASKVNAIEFTKKGENGLGDPEISLEGVEFTLIDAADETKVYTAVSNEAGKVRFDNIPDGTYVLVEETFESDDPQDKAFIDAGYDGGREFENIVVSNGQVLKPDLDGNNIFKNTSTKGRLTIYKKDSQDGKSLNGAVFKVYGPYTDAELTDAEKAEPTKSYVELTTKNGGKITSGLLENGKYLVVEEKAPTNYTAGPSQVVTVNARATVEITIKNDPQVEFVFRKIGSETETSHITKELAGVQFTIWTNDVNPVQLYGKKDEHGNFYDVSREENGREQIVLTTALDGTGLAISNSVMLSPGTYKYKEVANTVPAPYVAYEGYREFEVKAVYENDKWNLNQTKIVRNVLEGGQIRIVKSASNVDKADANTQAKIEAIEKAVNGAVFGVYKLENGEYVEVDKITTGTYYNNGQVEYGVGYSNPDAKLELGKTYYVKEISAPAGYAVDSTLREVTPTIDTKQVVVSCTNKPTVSITLTKVDSKDSNKTLSGAEFELYEYDEETGTKVGERINDITGENKTGSNGTITFAGLKPNTKYVYKEVGAPDGYVITESGEGEITTFDTGVKPHTVQNAKKATFKLEKYTTFGATANGKVPLGGVVFNLYKTTADGTFTDVIGSTTSATFTTNNNGKGSATGLTPGYYWLVETVPAGYKTNKANGANVDASETKNDDFVWKVHTKDGVEYFYKKIQLTPGENQNADNEQIYDNHVYEIINIPTNGKIQISKAAATSNSTAGAPLSGAVFTLYLDEACKQPVKNGNNNVTISTGESGIGTSGWLAPGVYYLQETTAPTGYELSTKVYSVQVVAGQTATSFTDVDTDTTVTQILNTKAGGFILDKKAVFNKANTNVQIKENLAGAKFTLYAYDAIKAEVGDQVGNVIVTGSQPTEISGLTPGVYLLRETETPSNFDTAADVVFEVMSDGTVRKGTISNNTITWGEATLKPTIEVDNVAKKPRIRLIKVDAANSNLKLNDAQFEVWVQDPAGKELIVDGATITLLPVKENGAIGKQTDQPHVIISGTVADLSGETKTITGEALTAFLEPGKTYYFKEIVVPGNYHVDPDNIWFELTIPETAKGEEFELVVENYRDINVPGIKYKEDGKSPLSGATFALFDNETDAINMVNRLKTDYNELNQTLTSITNDQKAAWHIDELVQSLADGTFQFANLVPGNTYYIVEVIAPNGYQLEKDTNGNYYYYKVVVSENIYDTDSKIQFESITKKTDATQGTDVNGNQLHITNYLKKKIFLDKIVVLSGEKYWVDNAAFTIYGSDANGEPDVDKVIGTMGLPNMGDGTYSSGNLPAGIYWIAETVFPEGMGLANRSGNDYVDKEIDSKTVRFYRVELTQTDDNEWFVDHPVYNEATKGKFALRKVSSTDANTEVAATFTLEKEVESGKWEHLSLLTGDNVKADDPDYATATNKEYIVSGYLEPGNYRLKEFSVSGNYTMFEGYICLQIAAGEITDGSNYDESTGYYMPPTASTEEDDTVSGSITVETPITVKNVPQGQIIIKKTGSWNGDVIANLSGVKFAVYKKSSDNPTVDMQDKDPIATLETDGSGTDSVYLDAGNYWVVETELGSNTNYQINTIPKAVTVNVGETSGTLTFDNTHVKGKLQITKVNSITGVGIENVTFGIYSDAECSSLVKTLITGEDGVGTSDYLDPGTYYIKETIAAEGYQGNSIVYGPFEVVANDLTTEYGPDTNKTEAAIENSPLKSLKIQKYALDGDEKTETLIDQPAKFALYATLEEAKSNTATPLRGETATEDGTFTWTGLSDGTYYLKEITAPQDYLLQESVDSTDETNVEPNVYEIVISDSSVDNVNYTYNKSVYNLKKGGFELDKVVQWTDIYGNSGFIKEAGISFNLYKGSYDPQNPDLNKVNITLATNAEGKVSARLAEGHYILVETASEYSITQTNVDPTPAEDGTEDDGNFIDDKGYIHIYIETSEINTVFTGDNKIINAANYGRFELTKKTKTGTTDEDWIPLSGAQYKIKKLKENGNPLDDADYVDYLVNGKEGTNVFEVSNLPDQIGTYISGHLPSGWYSITEIKAPTGIQNDDGKDVEFLVDPTPIRFEIKNGATITVEQYDDIKRNLQITKVSDALNGDENGPKKLQGVEFVLYKAQNCDAYLNAYTAIDYANLEQYKATNNVTDTAGNVTTWSQTSSTDANGIATFTQLEPGKYLLVENEALPGYKKDVAAIIVVDEAQHYNDLLEVVGPADENNSYTGPIENVSNYGYIRIRKEDTNSKTSGLQGAVFSIYKLNDTEYKKPVADMRGNTEFTTNANGEIMTGLLPVGTYWVVEEKAPTDYSLDGRLEPLAKKVTVSGDQSPSVSFEGISRDNTERYTDLVVFQNRKYSTIKELESSIEKGVRIKDSNTNFVYEDDKVAAANSLMDEDVTIEYHITNLTTNTPQNELPLSKFAVTDDTLTFYGFNPNTLSYSNMNLAADADLYVMNQIILGESYNVGNSTKAVTAKVYAKVDGESGVAWEDTPCYETLDLSESKTVTLPANTVGFRVEYGNADVHFFAGDIDVEVTFKKSASNETLAEVRKISNHVTLDWEDTALDANGNVEPNLNSDPEKRGTVSDDISILLPSYMEELPVLGLTNIITNIPSGGFFYSGQAINFETVGSVEANSPDLQHPVMSINLPKHTSLDASKYPEGGGSGIRATLVGGENDGQVLNFTVRSLTETKGSDKYEKYVLDFGSNFSLKAGESIKLEYTADISLAVPEDIIKINSTGFIGSAKQLALTSENRNGQSYKQVEGDNSANAAVDAAIDAELKKLGYDLRKDVEDKEVGRIYLNKPVEVELTRANSLMIRKYVSTDENTWYTTETPTVKPADEYYYKLTLVNGGDPVKRARIVDIIPFNGDTYEFRSSGAQITKRSTDLPYGKAFDGEIYEQVELISVSPSSEGATATVYYYVENQDVIADVTKRDWTAANRGTKPADSELLMLTSNAAAETVWAGWTSELPADMSKVTAIGVEVVFDQYLSSGDTYDVYLTMRAPGYTAEHMNAYADKIIANTTTATVTRFNQNENSPVTAVNRVSSNEVKTKLYITTGSIGDYAFYDNNDNGIQDEGDVPARNIPVTLYRRKVTTSMAGEGEWEVYKTTVTDQTTGKYLFDKLPCNYLEDGKSAESKNPEDYVGNAYFEYKVEFGIPDGYAATKQYADGGNIKSNYDSNIDPNGMTDPINLALVVNNEGVLEGEVNLTIDAGYVRLVNLGDYVWFDYNKNGIQDENEIGVNGATVNLYKLDSANDTIEGKDPYLTQVTKTHDGNDGYYCFQDLPKGYYVVEFDISTVNKEDGYTTEYAFTMNDAGSNGADSDAAYVKDENEQIKYTDVIHLTEDDMTWDAGVTVYSAIGGFIFDDQDYDDTQSIETELENGTTANGIPLPGTVVTLYKVNEDGSLNPEPIGTQTVKEDGRYFFDKLDEGRYRVHFDYPDEYIGVEAGVGDLLHDSENKYFDDETLNSGFSDIIELPADTADLTHDAGAYLLSAIGDYVWEDIDRDGIQDPDEKPVADIVVTLQQKLGDDEWTTIETTSTDENGLYLFDGLKSSDHFDVQYRVAFAIPLTVELTGDNAGEDRAQDSNALPTLDVEYGYFTKEIILPYGQDDMTIDAGLYYRTELCEVGDYVWYDDDRDGIQDTNEKGVEGIVVVLERCSNGETWDEEAWEVVGTTKTDANGKYIFTDLQPGYYRVAFGVGDPWVVTISRVGDIALDSDAIRLKGDYYYTSSFYLNAGDSDMTWDAGIYKPSPAGTETGDNTNIGAWLCALGASVLVLVFMLKKRKEI